METPPATAAETFETVTVLSISQVEQDHVSLERILNSSDGSYPKWTIHTKSTLTSALPALRSGQVRIVVSEADLAPGTWKDVLAESAKLPDPPLLIVTSRIADDHLWSKALNLGAYDVLAKPFDCGEVIRVLSSAWLHTKHTHPHVGQER